MNEHNTGNNMLSAVLLNLLFYVLIIIVRWGIN